MAGQGTVSRPHSDCLILIISIRIGSASHGSAAEKEGAKFIMISMPFYSPCDYDELIQYAHLKRMCFMPGCTTCGAMPFRRLCRYDIGFENICGIVRAVTPEYFAEHYTLDWMMAATVLDCEFRLEGGLPRDNFLLQELERLSKEHEYRVRHKNRAPQE